jgi:hypothetical protein
MKSNHFIIGLGGTGGKNFSDRVFSITCYADIAELSFGKRPMNVGGFSIWRFIGVSAFKSRISKKVAFHSRRASDAAN